MSRLRTRRIGGALILLGLSGGFVGSMAHDVGWYETLAIVGGVGLFWSFLTLAFYLLLEET